MLATKLRQIERVFALWHVARIHWESPLVLLYRKGGVSTACNKTGQSVAKAGFGILPIVAGSLLRLDRKTAKMWVLARP